MQQRRPIFYIALIIGFFFISHISWNTANAQKIGLKGAFNYSGFRKNPNLKAGYQIGVAGKKYLGDLGWFFQPEVNYSLEGAVNQPMEFINIPLLMGFDFSDNFNMHIGYQSGILVGTRGDTGNDYKTYNPGAAFGLEFYPSAKTVFGARYDYGLTDLDNGTLSAITINFEVYVIVWVIN